MFHFKMHNNKAAKTRRVPKKTTQNILASFGL